MIDEVSELPAVEFERRKNEKRDDGVGATVVDGVVGVSVAGVVASGAELLLNMTGGIGEPRGVVTAGFSIPISFMVAFSRSRSLRSSSSSYVSSLRAPVIGAPAFKVNGRKLAEGSGFFSPPNIEKLFQSNDIDRRDARLEADGAGGDDVLLCGEAVWDGGGEVNVVRRSPCGIVGVLGAADDEDDREPSEKIADWGRAFFGAGADGSTGDLGILLNVVNPAVAGVVGLLS